MAVLVVREVGWDRRVLGVATVDVEGWASNLHADVSTALVLWP